MVELYHGTNIESLIGITNTGDIRPSLNVKAYGHRIANFTFFGTLEKAIKYAKAPGKTNYDLSVLLKVQIDEKLLLPDDIHSPSSKTWRNSLHKVGQVKVKGSISIEKISNVEIFNKTESIISTDFGAWNFEFLNKIKTIYSVQTLEESLNMFNKKLTRDVI